MGKKTGKENRVTHITDIIKGTKGKDAKKKPKEIILTSVGSEGDKIDHLRKLISKPSKTLMDSGNLPDLKRELTELKSQISELSTRYLDVQRKIKTIEEDRLYLQEKVGEYKGQESKLLESLIPHRRIVTDLKDQSETLTRQKQEEEIGLTDLISDIKHHKVEFSGLKRELKSLKNNLANFKTRTRKIPDRILKSDNTITENLNKVAEFEKKLGMLEKEMGEAKIELESSMDQQRNIQTEYDRVVTECNSVQDVFKIYDDIDKLARQKQQQRKFIRESQNMILAKEREIIELDAEKESLKSKLEDEEVRQRHTNKETDSLGVKIRELESQFAVYSELDEAAKEVNDIQAVAIQVEEALNDRKQDLTKTSDTIDQARKAIQSLVSKEAQLKTKLEEVLEEKSKLESELQEISGDKSKEKLIIELPQMLRESIKKETDRIALAENKLKELLKREVDDKKAINEYADKLEEEKKKVNLGEKKLTYIKDKLGTAGYSEEERLLLKKKLDKQVFEKQALKEKQKSVHTERRNIKTRIAKTERQVKKLGEEIIIIKEKIQDSEVDLLRKDEELKTTRERKIRLWVGKLGFMRMLYPLKDEMDRVFDEKSKIAAELDEALKIQKNAENDLDAADKFVSQMRLKLNTLEEEYVGLQTKIHALEKQNNEIRLNKDSLLRQMKEEEEQIPLVESEVSDHSIKVEDAKNHLEEMDSRRKEKEKQIRAQKASLRKLKRKIDISMKVIKEAEKKTKDIEAKKKEVLEKIEDENTLIIQALDEKQTMEKELGEYRKQQSIIESEIAIIAGIYETKA